MKKIILFFLLLSVNYLSKGQFILINFESSFRPLVIDTTQGNIWQIGKPNKVFFDSAHSIPNAIVTDTVNPYPINNSSSFTIAMRGFWGNGNGLGFSFWHKYATDTLADGGYIELSVNNKDWFDVYHFLVPLDLYNFYSTTDTIKKGIPAFSGFSGGWVQSSIQSCLDGIAPIDTLFVRFTFKSDSIQGSGNEMNSEGWMIDDIQWVGLECDGVKNIHPANIQFTISPNPASDRLLISSYPSSTKQMEIKDLLGRNIYKQTLNPQQTGIDISSFSEGIYFVVLENADGSEAMRKFVKY